MRHRHTISPVRIGSVRVPGTGPLNLVGATYGTGQPVFVPGLLATITNPRIVIPHQEPDLNFAQPFFISDASRTFAMEQLEFKVTTYSIGTVILETIAGAPVTFLKPAIIRMLEEPFLRELEIGGVPQLMARNLQLAPQVVAGRTPLFDFNSAYGPSAQYVGQLYPGAAGSSDPGENSLDFTAGSFGAYSLYNWEVFYHIPMFVASLLVQNQQFQDAMTWLNYIFNPSDTTSNPKDSNGNPTGGPWLSTSGKWRRFTPSRANSPNKIFCNLPAPISLRHGATALAAWQADPFDPHAIAGLRISALRESNGDEAP